MTVFLFALASYLVGATPTSYLAGRAMGIDLREHGSGNLGATNAFRVLGWKVAVPVGLLDISKGFIPASFFPLWDGTVSPNLGILYGTLAIVGHVWSVFVRFGGGKGVATGTGVLLALAPVTTLIAALVWIGIVLITHTVSVASITATTLVPVIAYMLDASPAITSFCAAAAMFVWWTHRSNIRRLMRGEEHRFDTGSGTGAPG
jgi:glycerol-3-phosphate acyltransferase PlsY